MAEGWSTEETRSFLGIWGATDVQVQLDGIVQNQAIYEKIAAEMRDAGYEHACSKVQRKLEAVKPDKEPWRFPAC